MSLPVSQYEALLAEVRGLRRKAEHVQELVNPLLSDQSSNLTGPTLYNVQPLDYTMDSLLVDQNYDLCRPTTSSSGPEDEFPNRGSTTQMSVSSEPVPTQHSKEISSLYHGTWPVEKTMWNSEPINLSQQQQNNHTDVTSVMSFASSSGGVPLDRVLGSPNRSRRSSQQLEAKVDMVYSLLAMLGGQEHADMGETLLALSTSPESCLAMRQSGCIPLLVQLVQSDKDKDTKKKASQALHNLVHAQPDDKLRKRETRILKLLENIQEYTETLKLNKEKQTDDKHPVQTVAHAMKLSFDEGHRQAICHLGGIHTIANLVEVEHQIHGSKSIEQQCILMRRYACMALTNLTFGDSGNKALLCSLREFMRALVVQLQSPSDELRQVTASVLRNLSWRADVTSKEILREVGSVTGLMKAAMLDNKENTLKSILSALWNLSAHCTENKSEICAVEGALGFLVDMLIYKTATKSLAIIENSGGILRNISSQIAVRDDYREILRKHNCLQILLEQLKSPSLTIVSNACGTLWNLSAKCSVDQEILWQLGAPSMLRSLNHSKHKMIAMGSSAALKNLLSARPQNNLVQQIDSTALQLDLPVLPTLGARKQKALLQELDNNLTETYENIEKDSPVKKKFNENSLNSSFASLNINEPSTSYSNNFGNSSLPYSFIPVRNKFSDCSYEDEINEQPIDYSQKYSETKLPSKTSKQASKNQSFSMYAETDLDQPTDYSLRYAEDDSDSEICTKNPEYIQDTIKTYCTEDTPYETPFIFSTATSMSDLRVDKQIIDNDKVSEQVTKNKETTNKSFDEKDHCSTEDISDAATKKPKSEFSSGLMSPEKPVNYCEEGTPGYFSRVSSFGSMNSLPANETLKNETKDEEKTKSDKKTLETKAVKFEQQVNYAEETPLMFSRSSSLASLDSIEQHSIHDDHSSVVSDLRLTSGIVSPSELPDSPTQTVPQSPKFPSTSKVTHRKQNKSVFEDNLTKFKEESTPVQFSTATSLSSLTIDDEANNETSTPEKDKEKHDSEKEAAASQECEDERILAACINIGMQNNRHTQNKPNTSKLPLPKPLRRQIRPPADTLKTYCTEDTPAILSHAGSNSDISILSISNESKSKRDYLSDASSNLSADDENLLAECIQSGMPKSKETTTKTSCLQFQTTCDYLSDASSNLSADDDNILAECIKSGMPKAKQNYNNEKTCQLNRKLKCNTSSEADKMQTNKLYNTVKDECRNYVEISPQQFSLRSSLSDLTVDGSVARLKKCEETHKAGSSNKNHEDSFSSASGGSLNSSETEQAILDQCILAGMPKTGQVDVKKQRQDSKNVNVASVVTKTMIEMCPVAMADVVEEVKPEQNQQQGTIETCLHFEENLLIEQTKNGSNKSLPSPEFSNNCENYDIDVCLSKSCENSNQIVDNRMLDPDAMIESLDRFTAELVSQASHLNKDENNFKISSNGDCTWNEDSGVTFPSISGSTPNVITFKSDENSANEDIVDGLNEEPGPSNDFSSSTMTESTLIAIEANKLVTVLKNEAEMSQSTSITSLELDQIQPPSQLNSLTNSPKLVNRKKSLPASLLAKRAINNYMNHGSSIDSLSNLDHINPPSELFDSVTSLSSLQNDNNDVKPDFLINGALNKDVPNQTNPIFNIKQTNGINYLNSSIVSDLENVNPPSFFNEITDLCNSLADVNTEAICSETEIFEDCFTHIDQTEFSDANSITPIPSDLGSSSNESTPKKTKNRRTDRYKTYTINASESNTTLSDFKTVNGSNDEFYSIADEPTNSKLTPKQRRQLDSERFKTRVIDSTQIESCKQSPPKTKLSIRKSFIQKRMENKDRFRTQTLSESSFSLPENDLNLIVQKEANVVVKNLNETQSPHLHDLLDCETLSLVSNDDDSEQNSNNSINYRTYHKSWGIKRNNLPIVQTVEQQKSEESDDSEAGTSIKPTAKPKIVKPNENEEILSEEEQPKAVRGRRKPLYSRANVTNSKPSTSLMKKTTNKTVSNIKPPSGSQNKGKTIPNKIPASPLNKPNTKINKPSLLQKPKVTTPPLDRQGTFTKAEPVQKTSSKIPTFASKLAKAVNGASKSVVGTKSASSDRSTPRRIGYNRSTSADSRETASSSRKIQNSASSQSLKNDSTSGTRNGAVKKSGIPNPNPRSQTQTQATTTTSANTSTKKQVTSKIANLWKKIEESKKQQVKNDTRVWIEPKNESETPELIRSNTFDNKDGVVMRKKTTTTTTPENEAKRVSRLGSFIIMDENGETV